MHYQRGDRNETSSNTFDVLQAHHIGEVAVGPLYCDWTLEKLSGPCHVRLPYFFLGA